MESYTIILFILAVMVVLSAIAERIKLPAPIFLIMAGITVGFIPRMPPVELNPEIVF